jgi:hypothetical protein
MCQQTSPRPPTRFLKPSGNPVVPSSLPASAGGLNAKETAGRKPPSQAQLFGAGSLSAWPRCRRPRTRRSVAPVRPATATSCVVVGRRFTSTPSDLSHQIRGVNDLLALGSRKIISFPHWHVLYHSLICNCCRWSVFVCPVLPVDYDPVKTNISFVWIGVYWCQC